MKSNIIIIITILILGCNKSEFLSRKPDLSIVVPKSLDDFQALLDEVNLINGRGNGIVPALGESSTDNSYVMASSIFVTDLNKPFYLKLYTWKDDLYEDPITRPNDWGFAYKAIFTCNVVLEGLDKLTVKNGEQEKFNNIKGSALFHRAHMFYQLSQIFSKPYDGATSNTDLGIPLKLRADINEPITRPSIEAVHTKIINDLNESLPLLPLKPEYMTRPSKPAVHALLARLYLSMRKYDKALLSAEECLNLKNDLLDYNTPSVPNPNASFPFPTPQTNPEIIFYAILNRPNMELLDTYSGRVDSNLLKTYNKDDLRSTLYIKTAAGFGRPGDGGFYFRGSYDRSARLFAGLATDEVYLIRAECYARAGNVPAAMTDLNSLMKKRWKKTVTYPEITAGSADEAITKILGERRKELLFRGLRWTDLRRLNLEGANITISRIALGQTYELPPNSPNYTFLIPKEVMEFNPDLQQNTR